MDSGQAIGIRSRSRQIISANLAADDRAAFSNTIRHGNY